MSDYLDGKETRDPELRERDFFNELRALLASSLAECPSLARQIGDVDLSHLNSRDALAQIPLLRKAELHEAQVENPPFGGFVNQRLLAGSRIFVSPGPIWEPQAPGVDPWLVARSLYAAGIRSGDKVHVTYSYHRTPGGLMIDEGARALGCMVFPSGPGDRTQQVEAMRFYQPDCYLGTPDYLKTLLDEAEQTGEALRSIKRAVVSGGPLFPALRQEYNDRGIAVYQGYATADVGVIAYETAPAGQVNQGAVNEGMVCNEDILVEIVRPGTGDPVAPGEVGELVVTTLNTTYPLIRLATGDLSAVLPGYSDCGRTNLRIAGWKGRADQRTKIRGMFVDPRQVARVIEQFPGISAARLVVARSGADDSLTLKVQGKPALSVTEIADAARAEFNLRTEVECVSDPLPNDGKVIDDVRDFSA